MNILDVSSHGALALGIKHIGIKQAFVHEVDPALNVFEGTRIPSPLYRSRDFTRC